LLELSDEQWELTKELSNSCASNMLWLFLEIGAVKVVGLGELRDAEQALRWMR
jgi:hypothetical protein